ncbi:MAG: transaldolase [Coxiella sp. RIFCSPHIGHO2_12_FULL_42_15]|nr:MAG: transaldolase [Coxiella sp. RIFCSPHIGHO2_12_FULL_42_15]
MANQKSDLFFPKTIAILDQLKVKIFADGADFKEMMYWYQHPYVRGLTTNPSLMRAASIANYEEFGRNVLAAIKNCPISFEVFSDDFFTMEKQARHIATWGSNVNIKIPVTNTKGEFCGKLVERLSSENIPLNITALHTCEQIDRVIKAVKGSCPVIISVFAGRIADTGVDPMPIMREAVKMAAGRPNIEILWASSRELLNIFQAEEAGCQIITVPHSLLKKLSLVGKDLETYSLETVKQFYEDARITGYELVTA